MTEDTAISTDVIDKINTEIETGLKAETEQIKEDFAKQYEEKLSDLTKKLEELTPKPVDPLESMKQDLDESKKQMEAMKADYDKKMEAISLRKSVSVNDVRDTPNDSKKTYKDLSDAEKDNADKAYFQSIGIRI